MSIHQSPIPTILQVQVRKKKKIKEIKKNETKITVSSFKRVPFSNDYPVVKSRAAMF